MIKYLSSLYIKDIIKYIKITNFNV